MPIQLQAEPLLDLPTLPAGWELAATGVGSNFDVLVVAADTPFDARRAGESSRYRVYKRAGGSFESFEFVAAGRAAYRYVQPIGDKDFLLVTPWLYEGVENTGHIWSSDGTLVGQLALGQGIEHVQTSARSEVWVAYNDEGIFSAIEPGLACFDRTGKRVFSFAGDYGDRSLITRYFPESGRIEMGHAIGDGQQLEFTRAIGRADRLYLVANATFWLLHAD